MRALMWFRADLRTSDNTALHHACRHASDGVLAVFTICPKQWKRHDWGSIKVGFVLENLRALSGSLAKLNIPLKLIQTPTFNAVPQKLLRVAREYDCDALFYNEEYEVNEHTRDDEVRQKFEAKGIQVRAFRDQVILNVREIRTGTGGWYTVFTPFKRKWCALLDEDGPPTIRSKPRKQAVLGIEADAVPDSVRGFPVDDRAELWPAGERESATRLRKFAEERITEYERNRDFPSINGTSTLSPYLSVGVISPRQCLEIAVAANNGRVSSGKKGPDTWISELIWREFYRHILIGFPRVSKHRPFKLETDNLPWRTDERQFKAWCTGQTGFPLVDAAMRQLVQTGWMHNRLRMVVAMFLTKDLFIDWRWGEKFFMQHLVDGDLASNNGGWQWSASTGTDAAPYFRIFNPYSQSRKYDPQAEFIERFVPELRGINGIDMHEPQLGLIGGSIYPKPIIDRAESRDRVMETFRSLAKRKRPSKAKKARR